MIRRTIVLAAACAALLLSACDGASPAWPQDEPRALGGCQWAQEGCDLPGDTTTYQYASVEYETKGTNLTLNLWKQVDVTGRSTALSGVSNTGVSTDLKFSSDCSNSWDPLFTKSATAAGSPATAKVTFTAQADRRYPARWKAWSTHTFTPAPGYYGGGTRYTSWDSGCR
jgi:hypothetical protein